MSQTAVIGGTFFVYLVAMLAIGWVAYRRTSGFGDFILGGRRLGSWAAALSAGASDMSGWLLLGLPGYAYVAGLQSLWLSLGLLAGTWANWTFLARRLRVYTAAAGDALTLPEYFEHRFHDRSGTLRAISAVFILLFFVFYTSSGLVAAGKLFASVFGMPYIWAVTAGVATIVIYTSAGGFLAVCWTDVVQALLMAVALLAAPIAAFKALGGLGPGLDAIRAVNPHLLDPFTDPQGQGIGVVTAISLLAWGLGYFGQPHILARFKAISSARSVPLARRIGVTWAALTLGGATLVGLSGAAYFPGTLAGPDSEKVFILLVGALFHPLVAGICLAAVLAAIMSTADSQMLVASSAFTQDLYKKLLRREATEPELVRTGRIAVLAVAVLAFLLALNPASKVLELVAYAWAGFGAAFGPPLILSLYWRGMSRPGAAAGITTGALTVVIWKQFHGGIFDLYEMVPGCILATLITVLISLVWRPEKAIAAELDRIGSRS